MIADITFLNTPYAYSSRQIPIGDLSEYEMHTVSNVKCSEDLVQSIAVPSFDDYSKANMVMINDEYYWVSGYRTKTYQEEVVIFDLVYNPITSNVTTSTEFKGVFERTPSDLQEPVTPIAIQTDSMEWKREVKLPRIPLGGTRRAYAYVITTVEAGDLNMYLGFSEGIHGEIDYYNNGLSKKFSYPTIDQIVNDVDLIIGLQADTITNISVSERIHRTAIWVGNSTIMLSGDDGFDTWTDKIYKQKPGDQVNNGYVLYKVSSGASEQKEITITLTEKERHCGILSIVDNSYNKIASFTPYASITKAWVETVVDYYGVYTQICLGSSTGKNGIIRFNEGHLPWVGDNWQNYVARSLDSDRRELEMNISSAKDQRNIDLVEGAANAVVTGVIAGVMTGGVGAIAGVAQFAGSAIAAEAKGRLQERTSRETLQINQARVKDSATNFFNVENGVGYLISGDRFKGAAIILEEPSMLTVSQYNGYVHQFGYPSTGYKTVPMCNGYLKGMLTETIVPGLKGDLLNEELMKGVRILAKYSIIKTGNIAYKTGSTMNATVTYFRTSPKKGIIAFKGTFIGSGDMSTLEIVDVDKVTTILGITIKEQTYNLNGTWESQVPLSNEEHIKQVIVFGYHTQIGELDEVTSTFTPFNENTFNGKELYCYGIEVEEVEEV